MANNSCCPEPGDLWLLRMQRVNGIGGPVFTYTVPEARVLIINSWVASQLSGAQPLDLLRNDDIVATVFTDQSGIVNLLFPTGIAFFAGDTLKLDLTDRSGTATVYGHLQKA
jgi:hypothetical protein